jgi:hypothetical protein
MLAPLLVGQGPLNHKGGLNQAQLLVLGLKQAALCIVQR